MTQQLITNAARLRAGGKANKYSPIGSGSSQMLLISTFAAITDEHVAVQVTRQLHRYLHAHTLDKNSPAGIAFAIAHNLLFILGSTSILPSRQ
jgi:hypothetical protein